MTHNVPTIAVYNGLFARGTPCAIATNEPLKIPALPTPVIALPTMNTLEEEEVAQTMLPTSKIAIETRYVHLIEDIAYIRPQDGCRALEVRRYALPYHPTS